MMRIAVLLTCHNRRAKTIVSLEALRRSAERVPDLTLHVFLTDDGSTDGTSEAALALGMRLTVISGSGNLYWNRGMVRAWRAAIEADASFDAFVLLNDDTVLDEQGLKTLMETNVSCSGAAVVVGAVRDPASGELTYGGVRRASTWHPGRVKLVAPSESLQVVDTFNANVVFVPRYAYLRVGMLDAIFTHGMGDFDYGLRAKRAGVRVVVAPGTVGVCPRNDAAGSWRDSELPIRRRLHLLESPKGLPRREWREYLRRHGAPLPWLLAWLPTVQVVRSAIWRSCKRVTPE